MCGFIDCTTIHISCNISSISYKIIYTDLRKEPQENTHVQISINKYKVEYTQKTKYDQLKEIEDTSERTQNSLTELQ